MIDNKRNNIIFVISVIVLCSIIGGLYFYDRNQSQKISNEFATTYTDESNEDSTNSTKEEDEKDSEEDSKKEDAVVASSNIYCVGDSTTIGMEGQNNSYPTYLSQLANLNIQTIGDRRLDSEALKVKLGITPVYVDKLSIPAEVKSEKIVFLNQGGKANNYLLKAKGSIEHCTINGIPGKITYEFNSNSLLFTRDTPGEASIVNRPTLIEVQPNIEPDNVLVLYTGAYGEITNEALIANQQEIIKAFNTDKYIVVSLTQDERSETNELLKSTYGDHYLDFKSYLLTDGLKDAGITPTAEDQQYIAENKIPVSLRANDRYADINGNDKYSQLLAEQVLDKMIELKYVNKKVLK